MAENPDASELGYRVSYTQALQEIRQSLTSLSNSHEELKRDVHMTLDENMDLKKRVRALELRFYGILAGLVTAIVVLMYQGGGLGN